MRLTVRCFNVVVPMEGLAHLKQQYSSVHIYLWRNPWDQRWSYQINDCFDTATHAIINAYNPPQIIALLRE